MRYGGRGGGSGRSLSGVVVSRFGGEIARVDVGCGGRFVVNSAREFEDVFNGPGAEVHEAWVEGVKIRRGVGSDLDVGETFLGVGGVVFAVFEAEGGGDWVATAVVEGNGGVGDGVVARRDEGGSDAVADEVAFSVDGVEIHGELSAEGVEDGARGTAEICGVTAAKAARRATFLRSGSASMGGNEGKEMVGAEEPEPRVTAVKLVGLVTAAMVALENFMVKEEARVGEARRSDTG